ncbi:MAG: dipicolinate synthase subunit B [Ruminococcus sp.]|nr:dipicolinate synthase subunit B [Oscillospiraceae bacterium]MBR2724867.1 dipicolinate synthase subunit B [Ruminococcus sp.]
MTDKTVGYAICGSFCTFSKTIPQIKKLVDSGVRVLPIMSQNAYSTDTRFAKAEEFISEVERITGEKIINTISGAEPIGPKKMCDLIIVAPCTGNTLAKLANGVTDTAVTMALKSHLRIKRPVLLCIATNDGLGASAQNIGRLINTKNIYFVPFSQDDPHNKPNSLVSDFELIYPCAEKALKNIQYQPVIKGS